MRNAHIRAPREDRRRRRTTRAPQQRRARETVQAILDAVSRILKRDGVEAVTTNRIATTAGVSIGSLYQYFRDKRSILVAIRDRHVEQMAAMVEGALLRQAARSLDEILRSLVESMVEAHVRDRELFALLLMELPEDAATARDLDLRLGNALRLALAAGAPELDPSLDVERLLFVLRPLLASLAHAVALQRPARLSRAVATDEAVRVILSYIGSYRSPTPTRTGLGKRPRAPRA